MEQRFVLDLSTVRRGSIDPLPPPVPLLAIVMPLTLLALLSAALAWRSGAGLGAGRGTRAAPPRAALEPWGTAASAASEQGFIEWWSDADEEVSDRPVHVEGSVPSWLRGRLIRNGPARWTAPDGSRRYLHAFDGASKLSAFAIEHGEVSFSTRFLRSNFYVSMAGTGKLSPSITVGPVEPPWKARENAVAALTALEFDNTPVNLHRLGRSERWVTTTDAPPLVEIDPSNLQAS